MKSKLTLLSAITVLLTIVTITGIGFADEVNSVPPSASPSCPPNNKPNISISDTSVFLCSSRDSVRIRVLASDPDDGDHINVEKISGMGTFTPKNQLAPISAIFSFHPDTSGIYTFIFRVTDEHGETDQDTARITIAYNNPPQLTCPGTQAHHMNGYYTASQVIADDDSKITALSAFFTGGGVANLTLTNVQGLGTNHATADVNYNVTNHCAAGGVVYVIGTDDCGAADTCFFGINLSNSPPALTCPANGSVHAGNKFTSGNYSVTDPDGDTAPVTLLGITPSATNNPTIVGNHIEWVTTCSEKGDYTIRLRATDPCGYRDTCEFTVTVSNQPPVLTCPNNGSVHAGQKFTSSNFSYTDPEGDPVTVSFLNITPPATNNPYKVSNHIEWLTTCAEKGTYTIRLVAADNCGAKDTCEFTVDVYNQPPSLTCPVSDSINAGDKFYSTDYSVSDADDPTGVTVTLKSISPTPANAPILVGKHVEWRTKCIDLINGPIYTITLVATDPCGAKDTCQFTVTVYNLPPVITCPEDDSIHAGGRFVSTDFTTSDPKCETITVNLCGISPSPVNQPRIVSHHVEWQTACADGGKTFTICLFATDTCGAKDTCYFDVTVYNQPPVLTCPDSDSIKAGETFISTDFSVSDPEGDSVVVTLNPTTPTPTYAPTIVGQHISWRTTCADLINGPVFTFTLIATDSCGAKDTCQFTVTVYNLPPTITCPKDDSVHAGTRFYSTSFSTTDPKGERVTVTVCGITPTPTYQPLVVPYHVEWLTACADAGKTFTICLEATDSCGAKDTCYFDVTVYNRPPVLTCPDDDTVYAKDKFYSTNFSSSDPDGDTTTVTILDINPPATHNPAIVTSHVEWLTTCAEKGDYTIRLVTTDPCGLKDTCEFTVTVNNHAPILTCPDDDSVHAGDKFTSTNFSADDPDEDEVTVTFLDITPPATNNPYKVDSHIEWNATCAEKGNYTIRLVATDPCELKDTCEFTVTVYNQPPVLTCPDSDSIKAGNTLTSTDYTVSDPEGDSVVVTLNSTTPTPTYAPTIVGQHISWRTCCADLIKGPVFTFTLIATDSCGAKDTCQFTVTVFNLPPTITCPEDDSVHAGSLFTSTDFSTSDPKSEPVTVTLCGVTPTPANQPVIVLSHVEWRTACADTGKNFTICLVATDSCGAKDTCYFQVTVYNRPPQLTCPNDGIINATQTFVSTNFSVIDLDGDIASVTFLDITPPATNNPTIVGNHVEWVTTFSEFGEYIIRLVATDPCGLKDTCQFKVTVYNEGTSVLDCPEDDSVHAGVKFISTNYAVTGPAANPDSVRIISITPPSSHSPVKVQYHVELQTDCSDTGKVFTICLESRDDVGDYDTCCFYVTVYNRPPQLTCPSNDTTVAGSIFISTDFSTLDLDGDPVIVSILGISPPSAHNPIIVGSHVEWLTECDEKGDHIIRLVATDPCGLKDTCEFTVYVVCGQPPEISSCPNDGHTNAGLTFVSTACIITNPYGGPVTLSILDVTPTPHGHLPCIIGDHVEWITHVLDEGDYFIRILASDNCGNKDTCEFKVNLYNCHNPNFDITVSPDTQYVIAGQTVGFGVKLTRYFWLNKPCTLTVSGLPQPGGSGVFDRAVFIPTDSTLLNIFTSIQTDTGRYNIKIKAWTLTGPYSDYVEHETTFLLRVLHPIDAGDGTDNPNTPNGFVLYQNHPNPFNPETQINYLLPRACQVKLTIYNVLGQTVRVLYDGYQEAGNQTLIWDGRSKDGTVLSSGVYFYRLVAGDFTETKKMSFMK